MSLSLLLIGVLIGVLGTLIALEHLDFALNDKLHTFGRKKLVLKKDASFIVNGVVVEFDQIESYKNGIKIIRLKVGSVDSEFSLGDAIIYAMGEYEIKPIGWITSCTSNSVTIWAARSATIEKKIKE